MSKWFQVTRSQATRPWGKSRLAVTGAGASPAQCLRDTSVRTHVGPGKKSASPMPALARNTRASGTITRHDRQTSASAVLRAHFCSSRSAPPYAHVDNGKRPQLHLLHNHRPSPRLGRLATRPALAIWCGRLATHPALAVWSRRRHVRLERRRRRKRQRVAVKHPPVGRANEATHRHACAQHNVGEGDGLADPARGKRHHLARPAAQGCGAPSSQSGGGP